MSIFLDQETRVIVQGITGREGAFHTRLMRDYGTRIVAGVSPGKGGQAYEGIPIFDTVEEAKRETGASATIVFVPAQYAIDAIYEAVDACIGLIVAIPEGVPVNETLKVLAYVDCLGGKTRLLGPNCPGLISPGKAKLGIMPTAPFRSGPIGLVSRSGTLTYEIAAQITSAGYGQSTVIGIGGDPIIGTSFIDCLREFNNDPETEAIVLVGEIGGTDEEDAAEFVRTSVRKPVFGFVAGQTAPAGKRMGHAGAIIAGGSGSAAEKIRAFEEAGIEVCYEPTEVAMKIRARLK